MGVLRILGSLVLGSVLVAAGAFVTLRVLDWRAGSAPVDEVDDGEKLDQGEAEPAPAEPADPVAANVVHYWGHARVPRRQLDEMQLEAITRELEKRWPELRRIGQRRIGEADRVAFVVEVGSRPYTFARELMTGTVIGIDGDTLAVSLDCIPRETNRHGMQCESLAAVPRSAVVGWARPEDPEQSAELGAFEPESFTRYVRAGEPIELAAQSMPETHWSVEPAGAAVVDVLEHRGNVARIVLRDVMPGRIDLALVGGSEELGEHVLGRWPIVVVAGVA
jgi:hypothetical protein